MLTPLDIHNKEFKKSLRGYDVDEVDEFLDEVIKDFESLYKENIDIKEKIQKQQDTINHYQQMEETLQNTMVMTQKLSEETKRNAEKEAELIIWEARKKAEQIISDTYNQITDNNRKLEELKIYEKQLKAKLKSFLSTQLEMVQNNEIADVEVEEEKEYTKNVFVENNGD